MSTLDTTAIAQAWLDKFASVFGAGNASGAPALFLEKSYWRDLLALSWTFRTLHGPEAITHYISQSDGLSALKLLGEPIFEEISEPFTWIRAKFEFETPVARGQGIVRLKKHPGNGEWLALTLYTGVEELKGHEEKLGAARSRSPGHDLLQGRPNWQTLRDEVLTYATRDPEVIIIGAGQAGLSVAARLSQLNVDTLIVERNARVGDNWRNRYDTLALHDPVWIDHLPYVPLPDTWPVYAPKDKVGDYLESYAKILDLNVWTSTNVADMSYDEASSQWTVTLQRADGTRKILRPKHIILSTSISGEPNIPVITGSESFRGTVIHSSKYKNGQEFSQKQVAVVGTGNSAIDVAQDLQEHGANVTLIQRSPTFVISLTAAFQVYYTGIYDGTGPSTDDADQIGFSIPKPVAEKLHMSLMSTAKKIDTPLHEDLQKAGFKVDLKPDEGGVFYRYFGRRGGYFIDTGCAKLIIEGKIKVQRHNGIERFEEDGLVFDDGTKLEADAVILATGFHGITYTAEKLLGAEVVARAGEVWGFDDEGEINGIWKRTGHPGLWFHSGSLGMCRFYSKRLALQIKANLLGLNKVATL
ncbi:hypothetical protein BOTBODRAFT_185037 [Botryobasidium botryosum FD-172 SS1]|uniref:FAD/NAD(P)-binding domain-containing protein n=1 Tax=Botryobasidium botryosum (strain FD-172 SS1) TaxID=930990 RepID=A0A067N2Q4_BOTB1|nr:hypothetical protein BOTBODRAFT_185037 [Botryobasidium botryosum FD-172 SS1]